MSKVIQNLLVVTEAIICVTIVCMTCLSQGIDGTVTAICMVSVGTIAGFFFGKQFKMPNIK